MHLIVAVNNLDFIGKDGSLMWKCSEDMKHFKQTTTGQICVVGKVTWEKDLKGKPLPNREMILVTRDNVDKIVELSKEKEVFIIGGAKIYEIFLPFVSVIHLSIIDNYDVGDVKFEIPSDFKGEIITKHFKVNS